MLGIPMTNQKLEINVLTSIAISVMASGHAQTVAGVKEMLVPPRMTNTTMTRRSLEASAQLPKVIPTGRIKTISVMDGGGALEMEFAGELRDDKHKFIV
jgi:hypothetical protein